MKITEKLTKEEMVVAVDLVNKGLKRAAVSLKMILNSSIEVVDIDFNIEVLNDEPQYSSKEDSQIHILGTVLTGDLNGICHLIFTKGEVEKIYKKCLPQKYLENDSDHSKVMRLELLKEIDNIMAASVITEFANGLGVDIYGKVPSLHIMEARQVNKYICAESVTLSPLVQFSSVFHTDDIDIKSDFIWLLEDEFIKKIKKLALK